jgi:putative MATE family efflux protein
MSHDLTVDAGFWSSVREALRGSRQDYTEGPLGRAILLLAIPMVLEMVMESLFAVVDVFFVSRLGADAVATVGLTESLLALVYTVAMGLSIGVTATVARRTGERNPEGAAATASQGIWLGVVIALLIGIPGVLLAPRLLAVMGASDAVIRSGAGFTRVMLGGNLVIMLLFLINAIFRGSGDAAIAMRTLWISNGINMVLDPCLIFGLGFFPRLGVTGAAVATTTGRGIGVLFQLWSLQRPGSRVRLERRHLRIQPRLMLQLLRLSGSGMLQVLIGTASWIGLVRVLSTFGSEALAGYTIAIRVILFALLPAWGLSNAAATMVGQGLGAGKPDRAEQAVWRAGLYNLAFLGGLGLLFFAFAPTIISAFATDALVARYGVEGLRVISVGFPLYAFGMVLTQSFNGAGDTWTPTLINLACFWCWEIPLALILATRVGLGPMGVFIAIAVAFSTVAVVSAVLFRRGKWKERVV